jgi:hypothetical protein
MTWTDEADAYLIEATDKGITQREIARVLGTTHPTVRARARKLGVYTDKPSRLWVDRDVPEQIRANGERLRDAIIGSIARYANDNGLDIDSAARRLLSGAGA